MIKYKEKTREQYNDFLDGLTYLDVIEKLIPGLVAGATYKFTAEGNDRYERLKMENKPTRKQFEDEFSDWIVGERLRIGLIFDDLELEADLKARVNALQNPDYIIRELLGLDVANITVYLNGLVKSRDSDQIAVLESKQGEASSKIEAVRGKEGRKEIGLKSRKVCDAVIAVLGGWTVQEGMTEDQVDQLEVSFAEVRDALILGRAIKAYRLVQEMSIEGTLISQEMKDEMLLEFAPLGL